MKNQLIAIAAALAALCAAAEPADTLMVYSSWQELATGQYQMMIVDPYIEVETPWEVYFASDRAAVNRMLAGEAVAVALGDSIWMINTAYLKQHFNGNMSELDGYAPMLFNDKVVMVEHARHASSFWNDESFTEPDLYWVDFEQGEVYKLNDKTMSMLLGRYHDLQMRYDGMKNRKHNDVIRYFLNIYLRRIEMDDDVPYLGEIDR